MDEEKFIDRVEMMLYETCGCANEEAKIIIEKRLERVKKNIKERRTFTGTKLADPKRKKKLKSIESWANYVRTHKDEEWSKKQNIIINSQLEKLKEASKIKQIFFLTTFKN